MNNTMKCAKKKSTSNVIDFEYYRTWHVSEASSSIHVAIVFKNTQT